MCFKPGILVVPEEIPTHASPGPEEVDLHHASVQGLAGKAGIRTTEVV